MAVGRQPASPLPCSAEWIPTSISLRRCACAPQGVQLYLRIAKLQQSVLHTDHLTDASSGVCRELVSQNVMVLEKMGKYTSIKATSTIASFPRQACCCVILPRTLLT